MPTRFKRVNLFLPRLAAIAFLALASPGVAASAQPEPNATAAPILPDPKLTPGDVLDVSLADIRVKGYSSKVRNVRQGGTELDLDLEGGSTVKIVTAEETSSVMLRDKAGKLEYAD